jgi:hypothetical protein
MTSKRCALRFSCVDQQVSIKTAYEEGEARLQNISTAGCAFVQLSLPLAIQEKVLVSLFLPGEDPVFQAQGVVVRVETPPGCTAIHFTLVEPEDQLLLRKYFAKMMRKK